MLALGGTEPTLRSALPTWPRLTTNGDFAIVLEGLGEFDGLPATLRGKTLRLEQTAYAHPPRQRTQLYRPLLSLALPLDEAAVTEAPSAGPYPAVRLAWPQLAMHESYGGEYRVRLTGPPDPPPPNRAALTAVELAAAPAGDAFGAGERIAVLLRFSEPVTVVGTPALAFELGTAARTAAYAYGSGTAELVFEYAVLAADSDADGIDVSPLPDSLPLGDGTRIVTRASGLDASIGAFDPPPWPLATVDGTLSGTPPAVSLRAPAVAETAGAATVTVVLDAAGSVDREYGYETADDTALAGNDYRAVSGTLTVPAGRRTATFEVPVLDDTEAEAEERFTVKATRGGRTAAEAQVTVRDDDIPLVTVAAPALAARGHLLENDTGAGAAWTLARPAGATAEPLTVSVVVEEHGGDFVPDDEEGLRTATFAAGEATVAVAPVQDDDVVEPDGTVTVRLVAGTGYQLGWPDDVAATVVVRSEDAAEVTIAAPPLAATGHVFEDETAPGVAAGRWRLTRDTGTGHALDVEVSITETGGDGTLVDDAYETGTQTVTIPAGARTASYSPVTVDAADEGHGRVTVTVAAGTGYAAGAASSAAADVRDDDGTILAVTIDPAAQEVAEGETADLQARATNDDGTLTEAADLARVFGLTSVPVLASTGGGDAIPDTDYTALANEPVAMDAFGTLSGGGRWTAPVAVRTAKDGEDDSGETFDVTLSLPAGTDDRIGLGSPATASVELFGPTLTLALSTDTLAEGGEATVTATVAPTHDSAFTATLSSASERIAFPDGTTFAFAPDASAASNTLTVRAVDNDVDDGDAEVEIAASASASAVSAPEPATLTVVDDDLPTVAFSSPVPPLAGDGPDAYLFEFEAAKSYPHAPDDAVAEELTRRAAWRFTRDSTGAALDEALDIAVAVSENGGDFVAAEDETTHTVTFAAGESEAFFKIVADDETDEAHGTVTVALQASTDYRTSDEPASTVHVRDDDGGVVRFTVEPLARTVAEGGEAAFEVLLRTVDEDVQAGTFTALADVPRVLRQRTAAAGFGAPYASLGLAWATAHVETDAGDLAAVDETAAVALSSFAAQGGAYAARAALAPVAALANDDGEPGVDDGAEPIADERLLARLAATTADGSYGGRLVPAARDNVADLRDAGDAVVELDGDDFIAAVVTVRETGLQLVLDAPRIAEGDDDAGEGSTAVAATVYPPAAAAFTAVVAAAPGEGERWEFADANRTLSFAKDATASTGAVRIRARHNDADDGDLEVAVTATPEPSSGLAAATATLTVADDDLPSVSVAAPRLAADTGHVFEGETAAGGGRWTLTRAGLLGEALDVRVAVAETGGDGTLVADATKAAAQTVTFGAGVATVSYSPVVVDAVDEGHGTVTVTVLAGDGAAYEAGAPASAQAAVRDDDGPVLSVTIDPEALTLREGTDAVFEAHAANADGTLTAAADLGRVFDGAQSVAVAAATADGTATAPDDYAPLSTTLQLAGFTAFPGGGRWTGEVRVTTVDDGAGDAGQTFDVAVSPATSDPRTATGAPATATVTLLERPAVTLTLSDDELAEGGQATVTASLDRGHDAAFTVSLAADTDRIAFPGGATFTFAADASAAANTLTVRAVDNDVDDGDAQVTIEATASTSAVSAPEPLTLTVVDDDLPTVAFSSPAPTLSGDGPDPYLFEFEAAKSYPHAPDDGVAEELTRRAAWRFTRDSTGAALDEPLDFAVSVSESGGDFVAAEDETTHTVTFAAGESEAFFKIVADDDADEAHGTVTVSYAATPGVASGAGSSTIHIRDDDGGLVRFTVEPLARTVGEGASAAFEAVLRTVDEGVQAGTFTAPGDVARVLRRRTAAAGFGTPHASLGLAWATTHVETDAGDLTAVDDTAAVALSSFAAQGAVYAARAALAPVAALANDDGEPGVDDGGEPIADERVLARLAATTAEGSYSGRLVPAARDNVADLRDADDAVVELDGDDFIAAVVTVREAGLQLVLDAPRIAEGDDDAGEGSTAVAATVYPPAAAAFTAVVAAAPGEGERWEFADANRTLSFAKDATASTGAVRIRARHNDADDGDLEVAVTATPAPSSGLAAATATLTVADDDLPSVSVAAPELAADTGHVFEGETAAGGGRWTLTRAGLLGEALDVRVEVAETGGDGTLVADATKAAAQTVTFGTGVATVSYSPVVVDALDEGHGTVTVTVLAGDGAAYAAGAPASAQAAVRDDDGTILAVTIDPAALEVAEGETADLEARATNADGTLTAAGDLARVFGSASVPAHASTGGGDATAGTDYTPLANQPLALGTFEAHAGGGRWTAPVSVRTAADAEDDSGETFDVTLSLPAATDDRIGLGTPATATVELVGPALTMTLSDDDLDEGDEATLTATVEPAHASPFSVAVTSASDRIAFPDGTTFTFGASASAASNTLTVRAVDNDVDDDDAEAEIAATADSPGVTPPQPATLTVRDDDLPSVSVAAPRLAADTGHVFEGETAAAAGRWTLTRAGLLGEALDVRVAVAETGGDGTLVADATKAAAQTVTFGAGVATVSYSPVVVDAVDEGHGTVTVTVLAGDGAAYEAGAPASAQAAVRDDDGPVLAVTVDPAALSVPEGTDAVLEARATNADGTLTAAADLGRVFDGAQSVAVAAATADGTATAPDDYAPLSATLQLAGFAAFPGGARWTGEIRTATVDDGDGDARETFDVAVSLAAASDPRIATGAPATATVTLLERPAVALTLSDDELAEGGQATVTASLDRGHDAAFTVSLAADTDRIAFPGGATFTFAADASAAANTLTVRAVDNDVDDGDAEVAIEATVADTGVTAPEPLTLTVVDDDLPTVAFSSPAPTLSGDGPDPYLFEFEAAKSYPHALDDGVAEELTRGAAWRFTRDSTGPALDEPLDFTVSVSESGGDFVAAEDETTHTVTFAAGESEAFFKIVADDDADEAHGTVTVSYAATPGVASGAGSSTIHIRDDDGGLVRFTVEPLARTVGEGASAAFEAVLRTVDEGVQAGTFTAPGDVARVLRRRTAAAGFGTPHASLGLAWATTHVETDAGDLTAVDDTAAVALSSFAAQGAVYAARAALAPVAALANDDGEPGVDDGGEPIADERVLARLAATTAEGSYSGRLVPAARDNVADLRDADDAVVELDGDDFIAAVVTVREAGLQLVLDAPRIAEGDDDAGEGSTAVAATVYPPAAAAFTAVVAAAPGEGERWEFADANRTLSFAKDATASTGAVRIRARHNDADDGDLEVAVTATPAPSSGLAAATATLTVADDDLPSVSVAAPELAADTGHVFEGETAAGGGRWTLTRAGLLGEALDVRVEVAETGGDGTLVADATKAAAQTVTFGTGVATVSYSPVVVDALDEGHGTVTVTVLAGDGAAYAAGAPASAQAAVRDDDGTILAVTIDPAALEVAEGETADLEARATNADGTLTAAGDLARVFGSASVPAHASTGGGDATAGTDYTPLANQPLALRTFEAHAGGGRWTAPVSVRTAADAEDDSGETFDVTLSLPAATDDRIGLGTPATATVELVGPALTMTLSDDDLDEGDEATLTATVEPAHASPFSVAVTSASDRIAFPDGTTFTFGASASAASNTLTVRAVDNDVDDGDAEVAIEATADDTGVAAPGPLTLTVVDDDLPTVAFSSPAPTLSGDGTDPYLFEFEAAKSYPHALDDGVAEELTRGAAWRFTRDSTGAALDEPLDFAVSVSESGGDFVAAEDETTHTVTFAAGESEAFFKIVADDDADEAHGTVTVSYAATPGVASGAGSSTIHIRDDDGGVVRFTVDPLARTVAEGASAAFEAVLRTVDEGVQAGTFTAPGDIARVLRRRTAAAGFGTPHASLGLAWATTHVETDAGDLTAVDDTATVALSSFAAQGGAYAARTALAPVAALANDDGEPGLDDGAEPIADERLLARLAATTADGSYGGRLVPAARDNVADLRDADDAAVELDGDDFIAAVVTVREAGLQLVLDEPRIAEGDDDAGEGSTAVAATVYPAAAAAFTATVAAAPGEGERWEFADANRTLSFAKDATASTGAVRIRARHNDADDGDREVTVTATPEPSSGLAAATATLTVADDDLPSVSVAAPQLAADTGHVFEAETAAGNAAGRWTLTRAGLLGEALDVRVAVAETGGDGTLVAAATKAAAQTVTFGAGLATVSYSPVVVDAADEGHGTVTVSLEAGTGYAAATGASSAAALVRDDDGTVLAVTVDPAALSVREGTDAVLQARATNADGTLTAAADLGRVFDGAQSVAVAVATTDGTATAPDDYASLSTTLQLAGFTALAGGGRWTGEVRVTTVDDGAGDAGQTFDVAVSPPATSDPRIATGAPATATATLLERPAVTLTLSDDELAEGGQATVTASLDRGHEAAFTVSLAADTDRIAFPGGATFTFAADASAAANTLTVRAVDNDVDDGDAEVTIEATASTSAVSAPGPLTLTVLDDDLPAVSIAAPELAETTGFVFEGETGDADGRWPLTRVGLLDAELVVQVTVSETGGDATLVAAATKATAQALTFAANAATTGYSPVQVDTDDEGHGRVTVTVDPGDGTAYDVDASASSAAAQVRDDDGMLVTVDIDPTAVEVAEGTPVQLEAAARTEPGTFDGPADLERLFGVTSTTLAATTADGTATAPDDYTALDATVLLAFADFAPDGDRLRLRQALPEIATVDEEADGDPDETFTAMLAPATGVDDRIVVGDGTATVTLTEGPADGMVRLCRDGACSAEDDPAAGKLASGRVEVAHEGRWGTVCDDHWSNQDGNVACRQMGHKAVERVLVASHFGGAAQGVPTVLDDMHCVGDEAGLLDCDRGRELGSHDCNADDRHVEDAGVQCLAEQSAEPGAKVDPGALTLAPGETGRYWLSLTKHPLLDPWIDAEAPEGGPLTLTFVGSMVPSGETVRVVFTNGSGVKYVGWSFALAVDVAVAADAEPGTYAVQAHVLGVELRQRAGPRPGRRRPLRGGGPGGRSVRPGSGSGTDIDRRGRARCGRGLRRAARRLVRARPVGLPGAGRQSVAGGVRRVDGGSDAPAGTGVARGGGVRGARAAPALLVRAAQRARRTRGGAVREADGGDRRAGVGR